VTVTGEGDLTGLPAALEVAALRIAQEALHNAVRHAGADTVAVRVRAGADAVEVDVTDDGRGLPGRPVPGVGLSSMRERAAELGGSCSVGPADPSGTRVHAVLPIHPGDSP
jgi:signal transduction histidine kinase